MITTRDRAEALGRTCEIIAALDPPPVEVLITVDGCADDTMTVIRRHLPQAAVIINKNARGSVASRNVMMRQAKADLVFALMMTATRNRSIASRSSVVSSRKNQNWLFYIFHSEAMNILKRFRKHNSAGNI